MKLTASTLVRFGKRIAPIAPAAIACGFVSFFFVILGLITMESKPLEAQTIITTSLVVTIPLVTIGFVQAVLLRARNVAGQPVTAERYAFISDELAMRGIKSARRFMTENREYDIAYYEIASDIIHAVGEDKAIELASLVYVADSDPERAREAITAIVMDRGVTTKDEARPLLREMLSAKQAISSGAL